MASPWPICKSLFLAFDVFSTQEPSPDFIHPELADCSISVQLNFGTPLSDNVETFFLGERSSTFYVNSQQKVTKNSVITFPVDKQLCSKLFSK